MKNIVSFLIVACMLTIFSSSVLAQEAVSALPTAGKSTIEALKGLKLRQHSGVIKEVDLVDHRLVIKNRRGEQIFSMTPETQVKKGRKKFTRNDLKLGVKVTVRYWENKGEKIARIVKLHKN